MIIEFKFKNYRSFCDEAVLSLVASNDTTLINNTQEVSNFGNRRLLKSAVIFGPNAAGKTNIINALEFFDKFIYYSNDKKIDETIDVTPFLLDEESSKNPSEFEITILDSQNIRYQYGFQTTKHKIIKEWLVAYPNGLPQTWFERNSNGNGKTDWYFGRKLKGKNRQISEFTSDDVLFLSKAQSLNHLQLKKIYEWLRNNLRVIDVTELNRYLYTYSANKAKEDKEYKDAISSLLSLADFGISDFIVREEIYTEKDLPNEIPSEIRKQMINKKHIDVFMRHQNSSNDYVEFPMEIESNGTKRLFELSVPLLEVLANGYALIIDELDSSLHPLLVKYLIALFHNENLNKNGAQLIFNTHDTNLLDSSVFRRDQIWFVEKDRKGKSHLYSLLEYSPRKDESLAKGYLMGRYGALPYLSESLSWIVD
jgi:AAA15 family ATPase/GTPase